ncbi:BCCT family transporter [Cytobacillus purgationiresistens]|uniref:Glycine betaine transporter n=1 Tax=Cytobacillus purgationiresistens TaxID=863449 RepID=A0ABU0AKV9_9BACI|nr:BCCT family transporter [Cytobacillus purgationiresistens]MDQ0271906.1 glycine betaine transporter [Cytobacillus purgationiresistens]
MNEESKQRFGPVFYWSVGILILLIIIGAAAPRAMEQYTAAIQSAITSTFGWYYLIIVSIFVCVCLFLIVSPFGNLKLGKADEEPEYNYPTWFALLFSAGMGTGLLFWGTAEPISHFAIQSPTGDTGTSQAAMDALRYVFFHWGIHGWSVYVLIALCLAFFNYRRGGDGSISSTLSPLMNTDGVIGKLIDVVAIIATVTGIATTLGFGATQINGGISYVWDIPNSFLIQLIIIVIITAVFLISATTGINKGIRILSNVNMVLALILLAFFIIFGSTVYSLNLFTDTIGKYIQRLPEMSFRLSPMNSTNREWINDWTIFYWAWWMAWSPYVGTFIARVSRGRTIREFTIGVLIVPTLVTFIWFAFLGGTAIDMQMSGVTDLSIMDTEQMLFAVLEQMPLSFVISILSIILIAIFFITSGDSATVVLGMQSVKGTLNPSTRNKLIWGVLLSATATVLLYSGGLQALQNTMIIAAFPFSFVMILMTIALIKELRQVRREMELSSATKEKLKTRRLQKQIIKQELKEEKRWIDEQMKEEKKKVEREKKAKLRDLEKKKKQ